MSQHGILYPDTDYTNLVLDCRTRTLDVFSVDRDGDVEFCVDILETDSYYLYLDQEGIKLLIEHLQKQLK